VILEYEEERRSLPSIIWRGYSLAVIGYSLGLVSGIVIGMALVWQ